MIFRDLHDDFDPVIVAALHRDVLAASFSSDELVSLDTLTASIRAGAALVTVAIDDGGQVLGGIVGDWYDELHVLLISYLAVRPDLRRHAIGSELRARAVTTWPAQRPVHLVVAEVHDPRYWAGVEADDPAARLQLFERFGARLLDLPFVQPALRPGSERVRGFLLLAFHVDASIRIARGGGEGVPARLVASWIRRYYESAEGAQPPYDPELAALLAAAERDDPLPLLPLSALEPVANRPC